MAPAEDLGISKNILILGRLADCPSPLIEKRFACMVVKELQGPSIGRPLSERFTRYMR